MSDEKIFDLLVSRTLTRETSTLMIITVTASASLILIPLFCQINQEFNWAFGIIGVLFPIFGLLYREVTYRTIQHDDYNEIRNIVNDPKKNEIIENKNGKGRRKVLFYLISLFPVFIWIVILVSRAENLC